MTLFLPFIYDEEGYFSNDKSFILNSKGTNLKYIVGYLNTKMAAKWIRENCPELQGGTRELRKVYFENIPIPEISKESQQPIIEKVEKILSLKKANPAANTSEIEAEIDKMVYALYDLTAEEIAIVEGRN